MRRLRWRHPRHNVYTATDRWLRFQRTKFTISCAGVGQWMLTVTTERQQNFGLPNLVHTSGLHPLYTTIAEAKENAEQYRMID